MNVPIRYYPEVDSTNDIALSLASEGAPAGTAVMADAQRAGRGRRGRQWFSPPGAGLYLSVVLRPPSEGRLSMITLAVGVGVARAIAAQTALPVELKWPNDVVVGRPWRKLAGVLCESTGVGGRVDAVIAGVGINVRTAAYPIDLMNRATSIEAELGRVVDRDGLARECVDRIVEAAADVDEHGAGPMLEAWRRLARAGLGGARVRWQAAEGMREGTVHGIDGEGALLVDSQGVVSRLVAGDVQWERFAHD